MKRRTFLGASAGAAIAAAQSPAPSKFTDLKPLPGAPVPISDDERRARIEKARRLMRENKLDAMFMEPGSSVFYYTGARGGRAVGWILPLRGEPAWILPEGIEQAPSGGEIRTVAQGQSAFAAIAQTLKDRGVSTRLGLEEQVRFGTFDGLRQQMSSLVFASATPVTAGCRMHKSPAEIALMQRANDITIAAFRAALSALREGMTPGELRANISAAYKALGNSGGALIGFGEYTAFPHGSVQPQKLREGDVVLIDGGCSVEGYQSDITRTTVFGKPSARQRQIWDLERKAQDAAFAAAKPGATCESVDAAARKVITDAGFGPDYKVPGLPHRTGHGIGLDGHEWTNLVRGNKTRLAPGMCFSDEPMIAIYGEFGIRLEDCFYMTESGPRFFTKQSPAVDQPFG